MGTYTFLLAAQPSFAEGMARIMDLGDTLSVFNDLETGQQADALHIYADWCAVGDDIRAALAAQARR